jgi:magnesium transporter
LDICSSEDLNFELTGGYNMAEHSPLLPLAQKYFEQDIVGATHSLEMMDENDAIEVLKVLPIPLIVRAMKHLQVSYAASLLANADPELFKLIVSSLEPQFATTIFMHLPEDTRRSLIQHVPDKLKEQFREVLTYPEDSIGRLMSTDFLSFNKDIQVGKVVEKIRALTKRRYPSSYAYVIDDEEHLVGVINMRDLMLATPKDSLESVMRKDVFSLHCFVDREEAANELSKRRYFAAPVVDSQNHILGIIKAEQLLQGIQEEVTEDLQRMFGAGGDERTFSPVSFSLKQRLPWLHVNLATAFLAAAVVAMFEDVIAKITILAVFLPVVAGQGGNAGAQSLAVVMRGLVMREIPREKVRRLLIKEGGIGVINGIVIGAVTALVAWVWHGNPYLSLVIGLGMLVNLIVAGICGSSIPILMKAVGLDPAQCSSIILTTLTDVMGFFAFLGFAVLFQNYLV